MKLKTIFCMAFMAFYLPLAFAGSPEGMWTTIDDKTGTKRAMVQVNVAGNTLSGTIVQVFPSPGDTGICTHCPGAFKGKKIAGLTFLWGLKASGDNEWSGGSILDPKTGKIYKAKVTLKGDKLYVRGYLGMSLLGRTQTWVR